MAEAVDLKSIQCGFESRSPYQTIINPNQIRRNKMKVEFNEQVLVKLMYAFLALGACAYGCIFATYILWYMGLVS